MVWFRLIPIAERLWSNPPMEQCSQAEVMPRMERAAQHLQRALGIHVQPATERMTPDIGYWGFSDGHIPSCTA
ncbi:hypothetical protein CYMTET_28742 [Cymbomonas tetramitiformis]|uniref:Uncharacterized protein n=1 Tax=Cymbomonas tetramitiformis TaxID=36881 RepID=A0AAE0FM79_9CHLO|nr:hypothetical protein CYMTET_28742 [Cymbomonas tetramitiformis]